MKRPTARQVQVLDFVRSHIARYGVPPTVREIGEALQISSTNAVAGHLRALERAGLIEKMPRRSRGLRTTVMPHAIPIIGRIAAGRPIYAAENIEGSIVADPFFVSDANDAFVLKVEGDSMTGDAILPGDYLVVRRQPVVEQGQIAVVLIDDEATVKRISYENGRMQLLSSNPSYPPIEVREDSRVEVIGVVIGVLRRL